MKRMIPLLICLSMILSLLPLTANAAKKPTEMFPMAELNTVYESEPNDDRDSADYIYNEDCMVGTLDALNGYNVTYGDFQDYYEFYLSSTSDVIILLASDTGIGCSLVADDDAGTFLAHSSYYDYSSSGYTYEKITITLSSGWYYIMISEFMSSKTNYLLALAYESLGSYYEPQPTECNHSNGITYSGYDATCTEDGFSGNGYCNDCGELVEEGRTIPATGHDYEDGLCVNCGEEDPNRCTHENGIYRTEIEATCTEDGYTGDGYCNDCDEMVEEGDVIPATGHDYEDGYCNNCGEEDPAAEPTEEDDEEEEEEEEVEIPSFRDVPDDAYFADPVYWAVRKGITNGTSKRKFSPEDVCTRAHVVTFLWRAAGEPEAQSSKNPFKDVKKSDYFYEAVLWAVEQGITSGVSKTQFAPNEGCTRAQAVTFLWRFAGEPNLRGSAGFKDVSSSDYFSKSVLWAVDNDITKGTSNTTFSPNASCTRAQIVTFLYRADDVGALDPDYEPDIDTDSTDWKRGAYNALREFVVDFSETAGLSNIGYVKTIGDFLCGILYYEDSGDLVLAIEYKVNGYYFSMTIAEDLHEPYQAALLTGDLGAFGQVYPADFDGYINFTYGDIPENSYEAAGNLAGIMLEMELEFLNDLLADWGYSVADLGFDNY